MDRYKIVKLTFIALLMIAAAGFLHKNLPRTAVVQITGTDVKRIDKSIKKNTDDQKKKPEAAAVSTQDVRYINALTAENEAMVFRNEDTGWGWPPYFKFNSADVTAEAQAFATAQERPWVLVKYYGWRIRMFSMFPNVISLKEVDKDYTHIPYFNIIFVSLLVILIFFVRRKIQQLVEWVKGLSVFQRFKTKSA